MKMMYLIGLTISKNTLTNKHTRTKQGEELTDNQAVKEPHVNKY